VDRERLAFVDVDVDRRGGRAAGVAVGERVGGEEAGAPLPRRFAWRDRQSPAPRPRRPPGPAVVAQHGLRRAVGHDRAVGQDDDPVDQVQRVADAVLDQYQGAVADLADGLADQVGVGRVEVRGRLVEEYERRFQRQHAGQRQPLLLATGQGVGAAVPAVRERAFQQRVVHAWPDPRRGYRMVFQPERDVVAGAGHDELGLGVLEHDAGRAVDAEFPRPLAGVLGEQAGECGEQGALAGAGGAQQQYPLAALDAQVDVAQGPGPAPGVPPTETAQGDQTAVLSRPAGNRSSTPVRASPRVSATLPRPAITSELTVPNRMYGSRNVTQLVPG
jgi:hypothetical protein